MTFPHSTEDVKAYLSVFDLPPPKFDVEETMIQFRLGRLNHCYIDLSVQEFKDFSLSFYIKTVGLGRGSAELKWSFPPFLEIPISNFWSWYPDPALKFQNQIRA